jgi:hypothetical protein
VDQALAGLTRAVSVKLEEWNFGRDVRLLCSDETPALNSPATLQTLRDKHPNAPTDRRPFNQPDTACLSLSVDDTVVLRAIKSFPAGTSGGLDRLTAQHIKDMISTEGASSSLLSILTSFVNLVIGGEVPETVREMFFGIV